tara:strand:+ start:255 stop:551 length:297 start_codon:yes stop_codon:yes gene_type:complete
MEHVTENETMTRITIEHCDAGWEVISWYGSEGLADDLYDTKSEAIKVGRTMFNSTPSAMTLEVGSKNDFNRTMTTLRSRKSDPGAFLDRCLSLGRLFS